MSDEVRAQKLKTVKQLIKDNAYEAAFGILRELARPEDDFSLQLRYSKLLNSIPEGALDLKPIRISFAATSTIEHFIEVFRFRAALEGFDARTFLAEFDTMRQSVMDPGSELYAFEPDIVWLFSNYRDVKGEIPPAASGEEVAAAVESEVDSFASLWDALKRNSSAYVIQNNADLPPERVFGNFEGAAIWGRQSVLRKFNYELARAVPPGVTVFDIDYLSSVYGKAKWFNRQYWYHSKHGFALDACGIVAFRAARLISALKGAAKKCVVLDLDNTIWGGVVGDDGLEGIRIATGADGEAFADFQSYLKALNRRGIILAVCSKNDEENAKQPFLEHPDMRLKLEDVAVFKANWGNKAENIREIAETLDIGLNSLVFVDDNPFERNLVRTMLPMVATPEMPEDPALFIRTLDAEGYFETVSFSEEDKSRGAMYRDNAARKTLQKKFENLDDYLNDLSMEADVGEFDSKNLPRISQLINKSNQFHLTTTRYSEPAITEFMKDPKRICLHFRLKDRFGDNGLIAAVIMEAVNGEDLMVDTWVMSCRVLSRGMEEFIHNKMVKAAKARGCRRIIGRYIPTKKNQMVSRLYARLGYAATGEEDGASLWELDIHGDVAELKTFVRGAGEPTNE